MGADAEPDTSGLSVYGALLKDELTAQDARKSSFEQRGLAVVTSAGALVTLILALAAVTTNGRQVIATTSGGRIALVAGLVLFVLAAIAALTTNMPRPYDAIPARAIRGRLREQPPRNALRAERDIALTRVKILEDAKKQNTRKARALFVALVLEVMAVLAVAIAVVIIITNQPTRRSSASAGLPGPRGHVGPRGPLGPTGLRGPRGYSAKPDSP